MADGPAFDPSFRACLLELLRWRRDVRRFRQDPLPSGTLERLIEIGCLAPSVGLSEPWRFVVVNDPARRRAVRAAFETANAEALRGYEGERAKLYAGLKLAGLDVAPGHLAVFVEGATAQGHGLGRQTMPETLAYSVVMAMGTLWLTARAEGIGVGWVSIIDPARVAAILDAPPSWKLIGYLCVGYPEAEQGSPVLEQEGWERRRPPAGVTLYR